MSMLAAAAGILSQQSAFSPLDVSWHSAFWAEGPDFIAQGYSDTDTVTTWPNETGEVDASTIDGDPKYDASHASFNNQPVVDFDGVADSIKTGTFTSNPSYTSGVSIVVVAKYGDTTGVQTMVGGITGTAENEIVSFSTGSTWLIQAGTNRTGGTHDTNTHLFVAQFDGSVGDDTLDVDGTNVITASAGSETLTGIVIGNNYNGFNDMNGQIAFVGIYEGDFTADSNYSAFVTWAEDHYGLTIA